MSKDLRDERENVGEYFKNKSGTLKHVPMKSCTTKTMY